MSDTTATSRTMKLRVYTRTISDEEHAELLAADEAKMSRRTGRHGVKLLGATIRHQDDWELLVDALIDHGKIDPVDRFDALEAEKVKNFRCPGCGSSSAYAGRGIWRKFDGIIVSCGRGCKHGTIMRELGLWPDVQDRAGLSTRAIAPVVGVGKDTVARDLIAGVADETPAINTETGEVSDDGADPGLRVVRADEVTLRRVVYHWAGRMPLGAVTLMPGEEGIGKTTVGVRIMADTTRGTLPGEHYGFPRGVIIVAAEDGIEDVLVPRLREAGADLTRVHIVRARLALDGGEREVILPRDLDQLGQLVDETGAVLVWIDSLVTTLPDELKSISYKDTAKVLRKIGQWAESQRVAVAAPWHLNKAAGSDTAVRIMDSRAFRTAVRSMLLVVADPDAPEGVTQGMVALDKANAGTLDVPGLRYRIRSAPYVVAEVDEDTGEVRDVATSCGVADWIGEVDGDAREAARDALAPRIEKTGTPRAWLRQYLDDEGEAARSEVLAAAADEGYSLDQVKRASRALKVLSREEKGRDAKTGRPWRAAFWSLPDKSGAQSVHSRTTARTAPTGETDNAPSSPICAGEGKSAQSGRLGESSPTGERPPHWTAPLDTTAPGRTCPGCGDALKAGRVRCGSCGHRHLMAERIEAKS